MSLHVDVVGSVSEEVGQLVGGWVEPPGLEGLQDDDPDLHQDGVEDLLELAGALGQASGLLQDQLDHL